MAITISGGGLNVTGGGLYIGPPPQPAGSMVFDGTSAFTLTGLSPYTYNNMPASFAFGTADFTLETWIKISNTAADWGAWNFNFNRQGYGYGALQSYSNNGVTSGITYIVALDNTNSFVYLNSTGTITCGVWNHKI